MAKFTDAKGLDWHVKITALTVDNFEGDTGLSFFGEAATGKVAMRTAWRLCFFAVRDEAQKRGMPNYETWVEGIGKAAVGPMTEAVMSEIADFFPEAKKEAELLSPDPQNSGPGNGEISSDSQAKPE